MTFGRPSMISQRTKVPMPSMTEDNCLLENQTYIPQASVQSRMGLFICSLKLFEILDEVLRLSFSHGDSTYSSTEVNLQDRVRQQMPDVLRLNAKLDAFLESLPSHLQVHLPSEDPTVPRTNSTLLQARVLTCRFVESDPFRAQLIRCN